ncbi:hypothetical protein MU616_24680, partial [Salmonella enterica subsp. enterica serovar Enteritidis]|nr:hypothetical protein [Salmonella enterica subsp. enterica serovar Enteritidis]
MADLKPVYRAVSKDAAETALDELEEKWGVLEILCHSSNIQSKRNDTCPSPSISIKRLRHSSPA